MSLVKTLTDSVVSLWQEAKALRLLLRDGNRRDENLERRLAQLERAVGYGLGGEPVRGFAAVGDIVQLIITGGDPGPWGEGHWTAKRLMYVFDEEVGGWLWKPDDQDTADYAVMAAPGCTGHFPGCRGPAYLSHIDQNGTRGVWIMFGGEVNGWFAKTTGPGVVGMEGPPAAYPWVQTGLTGYDHYSDGDLGGATLLSSEAWSEAITERNELPTGAPIFMWCSGPGPALVFETAREPMAEVCPE